VKLRIRKDHFKIHHPNQGDENNNIVQTWAP
jgi:hypothetical protein